MAERITILGGGAMGTVCAMMLDQAGHQVTIYLPRRETFERLSADRGNERLVSGGRIPASATLTTDPAEALERSTMILSAIPTQHLRDCWEALAPHADDQPVVSLSKGIESNTLLRPTQIIGEILRHHDHHGEVATLSGPNIAAELAVGRPASAVVACYDMEVACRIQHAMNGSRFRVYTNFDVIGVEIAGAVKNVIAIAAGMCDGLGLGDNSKAALVTRGLIEITRLGVALGANPLTFQGLAGLGDLITTCVSPLGRNRTVGQRLGRGEKLSDVLSSMASVAEGVPTTDAVLALARREKVDMPIAQQVHDILFAGKDPMAALRDLMSREPKSEI
jgi:glycerol-3-phosphate dehydrogenase (NAD(P)+)